MSVLSEKENQVLGPLSEIRLREIALLIAEGTIRDLGNPIDELGKGIYMSVILEFTNISEKEAELFFETLYASVLGDKSAFENQFFSSNITRIGMIEGEETLITLRSIIDSKERLFTKIADAHGIAYNGPAFLVSWLPAEVILNQTKEDMPDANLHQVFPKTFRGYEIHYFKDTQFIIA